MADTITTTTQVPPAVSIYYDRTLLEAAFPYLIHERFAQKRPIPSNSGNTVKFRRYANLSVATTPLPDNGASGNGKQLSKTDLTAQISWYGDYVTITDVVDLTVEDPVMTVAAEKLGKQMAQTRDQIIRDILAACASSTNASGGTNGATPTEITQTDIDGIVKTMLGNDAKMMTSDVYGSQRVGSSPLRKAFWGYMDTDLIDDFELVDKHVITSEYPNGDAVEGEWCSTGNVRWLMTSVGYTTGSPTQYYLPIIGEEAYACTDLEAAAQNIRHGFDSGGVSSPLNRVATSGWKMAFVSRILNDNYMHILKVTHTT
ncbi:MAG: N4-gp56 family major capsid protein [Pseudomonadota bacterium]